MGNFYTNVTLKVEIILRKYPRLGRWTPTFRNRVGINERFFDSKSAYADIAIALLIFGEVQHTDYGGNKPDDTAQAELDRVRRAVLEKWQFSQEEIDSLKTFEHR